MYPGPSEDNLVEDQSGRMAIVLAVSSILGTGLAGVPDQSAQQVRSIWKLLSGKTLPLELSGNANRFVSLWSFCNQTYAFTARSWELQELESIDVMDAVGSEYSH